MRRNLFTFFLILIPFGVYSQIVISGTGQLTRTNFANVVVTGNWTNNSTSSGGFTGIALTGGVVFSGTGTQTINGSRATSFNNFGINNTAGVNVSGVDININALTFYDGILTVPAPYKVNIPAGGSMTGAKTSSFVNGTIAKTGNTAFTFEVGNGTKWAPIGITAPTNTTDVFEATYVLAAAPDQANIPANIELVSGFEYWNLQRTAGSANVSVTLHWKNSQESEIGANLTHLFIVHHDGVNTWDVATNGGTSGSGDLNSVQVGSITGGPYTSFGYFTFGSDNSTLTPLPVELVSFVVRPNAYGVQIDWITASEYNNDFFTIEKSANSETWQTVATINGAGYTTTMNTYSETDRRPFTGISYYRLKQTDFDGTVTYSEIRAVNYDATGAPVITLYPNPTTDRITIEGTAEELAEIRIFNALGQEKTFAATLISATDTQKVYDLSLLAAGIYSFNTRSTSQKVYKH